MTLHEVVLLYDSMSETDIEAIKESCLAMGADLKIIGPDSYKVPVGFLCYGNEDQISDYLVDGDRLPSFEKPMMILAGFTNDRIHSFLSDLREQGVPPIALKAVLTEYNATWDSLSLYEELKKEDEYMKNQNPSS